MAKVKDIDLGFKAIEKELRSLSNSYVDVGIIEGTVTKAQVKEFRFKPPGLNMAEIGYVNEYGEGRIPARPFIRTTTDEQNDTVNRLFENQVTRITELKQTAKGALQVVGVFMEGAIKQKIRSINSPPNAPSTIAIKGSSKPLIDFGQMIQSIAFAVFIKK